jgi:gliding motility associated protien GldN
MRRSFVKILLLLTVAAFVVMDASAQRRRRTTRTDSTTTPTNQPTQQVQQNNTQAPNYNPYGNTPIEQGPKVQGGFNDTLRVSRRVDNAVDKGVLRDRVPLPYEHLRWDDALYTERVWREIDLREKINLPFMYKAESDNGDQRFISILLKAVLDGPDRGGVTAWDATIDDRFTTPLDSISILGMLTGGKPDTTPVYDPADPTRILKYVVTQKTFNPEDVQKIRIKEEWVFDRESSRMFVRILGIAPLKMLKREDGTEIAPTPLFWVYYPDMRPILAKNEVYNAKNMGMGRMTWEELFESRMFGSYIVKSSLDNPLDKNIRDYIKDPILRLLEGENIKERIFNYEQDLWSY